MPENTAYEIERKFIMFAPPLNALKKRRKIRQGYLSGRIADVEVRIRAIGRRRFMTLKSGYGLVRQEQEMRISRRLFESLWPFTQKSRITKTRYTTTENGHNIEIDVYHDELDSLVVAEVELESGAHAADAELPSWLGTEITGLPGFANSRLAHDGLPVDVETHRPQDNDSPFRPISHAGAIPYRTKGNKLEILCVTSKSGKRWIIPKGQWEDGYDLRETAVMETWEESGAIGTLGKEAVGVYEDDRSDRPGRILVYPLLVDEVRDEWPESGDRDRAWLAVADAVKAIDFKPLADLVERFGQFHEA